MSFQTLTVLFTLLLVNHCEECPNTEMLVTFHPHMDIFWLNSESQLRDIKFIPEGFLYSMNQRNSKTIYNSMLDGLTKNSSRKYFTTEVYFFKDWYEYLNDSNKQAVKALLSSGQLQIANSGWVENDEAVTYYDDIIEQYTLGMNYMYQEFRYISRIGWATDCFGHSNSQAALLNELGFEMQSIERLDQRYIHERVNGPLLEFYWKTKSDSNNRTYGGLLTHINYFLHQFYDLRTMPVANTIQQFKNVTVAMQSVYQKKLLFRFLGNDFQEFTDPQFTHLETVMKKLNDTNADCGGYHYGNPRDYLAKIKNYWSKHPVTSRQFDFMPDWDQDRYWVGYFTTDPQTKKKCRDSSRILNFYKRSVAHAYSSKTIQEYGSLIPTIRVSEDIVSMMQHHDGITATSKHWIMLQMQNKMTQANSKVLASFKNIVKTKFIDCNLFQNDNQCQVTTAQDAFVLNIYHYGTPRNERIEVTFKNATVFKPLNVQNSSYDILCSSDKHEECTVVMSVPLSTGLTQISFAKTDFSNVIVPAEQATGSHKNCKWEKSSESFKYSFQDKHLDISYHQSTAIRASQRTMSWDKYNRRTDKIESPTAGIYIMVNNGNLYKISNIATVKIFKGSRFLRIVVAHQTAISSQITIDLTQPKYLDINSRFRAPANLRFDYFMKVSSAISNPQKEFYHDANGYLVMKRTVGTRPDYKFTQVPEDRMNANTYPMTAFAYIKDETNKLVVFTDRAQGVTIFEPNELLINIDRLTFQDGKGVGEQYSISADHRLRHKVALTDPKDDIERLWQKEFDEAVFGQYGNTQAKELPILQPVVQTKQQKYIKYTVAYPNNHSLVIRVQNLAEFQTLKVRLFDNKSLKTELLKLNIEVADWTQSYLNGFPLANLHSWIEVGKDQTEVLRKQIQGGEVALEPLQIRSFRLDIAGQINENGTFYNKVYINHQDLENIKHQTSPIATRTPRLTRCF